jgi:hypothetical protein
MKRCAVPLVLALVFSALPVLADEVIYFTNGTTMAIRSHEVEGDMIRVSLGAGAVMAFPISMVERVQVGSRDVFTGPAYRPSNQALAGEAGARAASVEVSRDSTVSAEGSLPARYRMNRAEASTRAGSDDSFTAPASAGRSSRMGPASRLRRPNVHAPGMAPPPEGSVILGDRYVLSSRSTSASPDKPEIMSFGPRAVPDAQAPQPGGEVPPSPEPTPPSSPEPPPESN